MTPWALPALFSSREGKENEVLSREDIGKTGAKAPKFPSSAVVVEFDEVRQALARTPTQLIRGQGSGVRARA